MVTHEDKYRDWLLEYVDAWKGRVEANDGNIPSNIGLDGTIGGEWDGKWYGGVFGWNSQDEGVRNYVLRGPPEGFGNALLLTGDQGYTQVLRGQIDILYANSREEDGRILLPRYYGDAGWYGHHDGESGSAGGLTNLRQVETDVYLWSLEPGDLARLPKRGWIEYLTAGNPDYPLTALQQGLDAVRRAAAGLRADTSSYNDPPGQTRGFNYNPVSTTALINLTMGGNDPGGSGHGPLPLHTQLRHFDPDRRRAGLPEDVAALIERIEPESVTLKLVNVSPFHARTVTVQMGGYGEHHCPSVTVGDRTISIDAPYFSVRLAPGAGETLTIRDRTLRAPTDAGVPVGPGLDGQTVAGSDRRLRDLEFTGDLGCGAFPAHNAGRASQGLDVALELDNLGLPGLEGLGDPAHFASFARPPPPALRGPRHVAAPAGGDRHRRTVDGLGDRDRRSPVLARLARRPRPGGGPHLFPPAGRRVRGARTTARASPRRRPTRPRGAAASYGGSTCWRPGVTTAPPGITSGS